MGSGTPDGSAAGVGPSRAATNSPHRAAGTLGGGFTVHRSSGDSPWLEPRGLGLPMSSSSPAVSKDDAAVTTAGSPLPGHVSATGDREKEKDKEKEATGPMSALAQLTAIATADISLQDVLADPVALELFKVGACVHACMRVCHDCRTVCFLRFVADSYALC